MPSPVLSFALLLVLATLLGGCGDAERLSTTAPEPPGAAPEPFSVDLEAREAAVRGRRLFMQRGCAGCHDVRGQRTLAGPGLAGLKDRMEPARIRRWIRDPQAVKPGTLMPPLPADAAPDEAEYLTAYLLRLEAAPDPMARALAEARAAEAPRIDLSDPEEVQRGFGIYRRLCLQCHPLEGEAGEHQLPLAGVGARLDADALRTWVRDPVARKPDTRMPPWRGNAADLERVVAFLLSLKG